jgi:class 3 adenylate cyclase
MGAKTTVMFADLTGSTSVFETLGNDAATQTIRALTHWIGQTCELHGGRVVKTLGDGVLALFPDATGAIDTVVRLQREHARRQEQRGPAHRMQVQVGLACGDVVEVSGDCFGDAVNVAARLSDLAGPREVLATHEVVRQLAQPPEGARFHDMGNMPIRGKSQEHHVVRIEWEEETSTEMLTLPAMGLGLLERRPRPVADATITLAYLQLEHDFDAAEMPVHLGRAREAEFPVVDPRVSRLHARIEWRGHGFVLVDLSSYGTCVRFTGSTTELRLRREECVLHDSGEIALASDFGDFTVPTVRFELKR